ncbi:MAG: chromate transporter [Bacillota bacterium]
MILFSLFIAFLSIGVVSFGGGYAMLPLFERIVVEENQWLTMELFIDMLAISQVTPGPIAINSATFIGYQTTNTVLGAAVATIGVVTVPVILVSFASYYSDQFKESLAVQRVLKGLRPALVGLIMASVYSVAQNAVFDFIGPILIVVFLFMLTKLKLHPILVIIISGILGIFFYHLI